MRFQQQRCQTTGDLDHESRRSWLNPLPSLMLCVLIVCLLASLPVHAQTEAEAAVAFQVARDQQQEILNELARILRQEKVMLSDGAVQLALETLLDDHRNQIEGIKTVGRRTLGKPADELSDADQKDIVQLAENQQVYADRYKRLAKGIETKAASRPDSVFVQLLMAAEEGQLHPRMLSAAEQIQGNQLGNALRVTREVVGTLESMVELLTGATSDGGGSEGVSESGQGGFTAPSLLYKAPDEKLLQFGWSGANPDPLGAIMRGMKKLRKLAQEQQKIAAEIAGLTDGGQEARSKKLVSEEKRIRDEARAVGNELEVLDPNIKTMVEQAAEQLDESASKLSQQLPGEAQPAAEKAAEQLQQAAEHLEQVWKDVLERIKQFTQNAISQAGAGGGIPHGVSPELIEHMQKLALRMLRATGGLVRAIEKQNAILEETRTQSGSDNLAELKAKQNEIPPFVVQEVAPFIVTPQEIPGHPDAGSEGSLAREFLKDAIDRMAKAGKALNENNRQEAIDRQTESVEMMNNALDIMARDLQRLLGQLAPSALTSGENTGGGLALDPQLGGGGGQGWLFTLPSDKQESVRQAFRGSFPQRYETAIKLYYQALAGVDDQQ